MKARISIVAALAVMTAPAFAQEAPMAPTQETAPSTQTDQMAPAAPAPEAPAVTDPAPAAPTMDKEATAPAASGTAVAGNLRKSEDDAKMVAPLNATVDSVEDMDIYDASGKKIAEVESVLEDSNGEIKGLAIEYGGFLGFGESDAIVTIDQVKQKDGNLVTEMTAEQLPSLPVWKD